MKRVVGGPDIEIDNYVFIGFNGFERLIAAVGGVVTLARDYYDPYYWVQPHPGLGRPRGPSSMPRRR
jgi:anionic cell wall polymer biosynthesis LytR-Cps2A-Psr (LCP) family protein